MTNYNSHIERWDKYHCAQHVEPFLCHISGILQSYYKNNPIIFIDIGANVGKVYDLLEQKSILNIEKAYLFEASERLYSYMIKKYNNNNKVFIFNDIILDEEIEINFDDDYIDHEIQAKNEYINFGLSKTNMHKNNNKKISKTISKFITDNELTKQHIFIKIDTENSDMLILKDILSIINDFKYRPIIEFEINYFVAGHTIEFAQKIIDEYSNKYNYQYINLTNARGDGLLIPNL